MIAFDRLVPRYEVYLPVCDVVVGRRIKLSDAKRLQRKYSEALIRDLSEPDGTSP